MENTITETALKSRIIRTESIMWRDLVFLQSDEFKELSVADEEKLRQSILSNQFTDPFKVWLDDSDNTLYCLDGKHRTIVLEKMITEGITVPELLPATFIECANKQEAATLVLQFSSQYARTTYNGILGFIKDYSLDIDEIGKGINIPEIDMQNLYGDLDRSFGENNEELNLQDFTDEVILKLTFTSQEYIEVKQRLHDLMGRHNVGTPEELIKILLQQ